jgi:hypothetical protein
MMLQGSTLRVLKYQSGFLSSFEQDTNKDPTVVQKVTVGDDKDDNLFLSRLPPRSGSGIFPIPLEEPSRVRYGYPICWSQKNYEWYPYLPAVFDWHYPIFRGVSRNPDIIYDGTGYRLNDEQMALWQSIEFVMLTVSKAAGSGQLVSLEHQEPEPPSSYGYTQGHAQSKFAKKCVIKSLNAFQRLLGYCAYSVAEPTSLAPLSAHARFFSDRWVSDLYQKFDPKNPDVHTLTKLLLSTLWKMQSSGNHAGIVLNYEDDYDYSTLECMSWRNVPVYVAWPGPSMNPYTRFRRHHYLKDFLPKPEQFKALESPPTLQPATVPAFVAETPAVRYGIPPTPEDTKTYNRPVNYVTQRLQEIPEQLEQSSNKQSMLD